MSERQEEAAVDRFRNDPAELKAVLDAYSTPQVARGEEGYNPRLAASTFQLFTAMRRLGELGDDKAALTFRMMLTDAKTRGFDKDNVVFQTWLRLWGLAPAGNPEQAEKDREYLDLQWRDLYDKYLFYKVEKGEKVEIPDPSFHAVDVGVPPPGLEAVREGQAVPRRTDRGDWVLVDRVTGQTLTYGYFPTLAEAMEAAAKVRHPPIMPPPGFQAGPPSPPFPTAPEPPVPMPTFPQAEPGEGPAPEIVPAEDGLDLQSADGQFDAHIRIERYPGVGPVIAVDVFRSSIAEAGEAHVDSYAGGDDPAGASDVTDFLRGYGFNVRVEPT